MISRGYAWIDEDADHSERDEARAKALAERWSSLSTARENRRFIRQAEAEEGRCEGPEPCGDCEACAAGNEGECEVLKDSAREELEREAERDLEIELIQDKLAAIGARMMRPYEHWAEDERYMEYAERDRD